jgi:hypothetical protein
MMIGEKEKEGVNGGNWILITLVTGYGFSHPASTRQTVTASECGRVGGLSRGRCGGVGVANHWAGMVVRVKGGQPRPLTAHVLARLSREALNPPPWHGGESCTERAQRGSGAGAPSETSRIPVGRRPASGGRGWRHDGLGQAGLGGGGHSWLQAPSSNFLLGT